MMIMMMMWLKLDLIEPRMGLKIEQLDEYYHSHRVQGG